MGYENWVSNYMHVIGDMGMRTGSLTTYALYGYENVESNYMHVIRGMRIRSPTTYTLYGNWEPNYKHVLWSMIIGIPTNTCYRGHGHLLRPITNTLYKVLKLGVILYTRYMGYEN